MEADKNPWRPKTLTMMGGPIDTREAPTTINTLATQRPLGWFQNNVVATVPMIYPGSGRKVYPGFLQLAGFMTMNLGDHLISHWEMFRHLVDGDDDSADATRDFYAEYRSVCDMSAEFYLQTVDVVFQRHLLPEGKYMHRKRRVDPAAIRDTALLAIEGERDDISGIGQTRAALDIAKRLIDYGFHPPTIYFPIVVEEALMIEPTETESLETLDSFVDAMLAIAREAEENPQLVKTAPHTTEIGRLDEVAAVRRPNLRWPASAAT
jgi:hypothetical protein